MKSVEATKTWAKVERRDKLTGKGGAVRVKSPETAILSIDADAVSSKKHRKFFQHWPFRQLS